jgi:hypothetical protein
MGFLLGTAIFGALVGAAILMLLALVLKLVFLAITLPIRLLFGLLFFPVWIVRTILRAIGFVVLGPLFALLGILLAGGLIIAGLVALVVPLLPLLIVGVLIWLVVRSFSHRAVPAG